ncbi:MAG: hypothetical protein JRI68_33775, partial [Deltaproteobacteria bacterium]|nr:hypothetical protein [Deltaproteobacteria bacterium]
QFTEPTPDFVEAEEHHGDADLLKAVIPTTELVDEPKATKGSASASN